MDAKMRSSPEVLEEFRQSGLTQKVFCELRGIPKSTLGYWLRRERRPTAVVVPLVRVRAPVTVKALGKIAVRVAAKLLPRSSGRLRPPS